MARFCPKVTTEVLLTDRLPAIVASTGVHVPPAPLTVTLPAVAVTVQVMAPVAPLNVR
jgi:hypothetical protein